MEYNTILYIGYEENSGKSAIDELREKGYEVVSTDSPTEAVALLYVMRSVAAVVLGNEVREEAAFDLAYSLRQIRPNIPVIMMCGDQINGLPSKTKRCVSREKVALALQYPLAAEPVS